MTTWIALLRAVNVGGTGKLPMADLRALCERIGFINTQTYIASGNVVFESSHDADRIKNLLEAALMDHAGKPVGVVVRSAIEMSAVLAGNPFPGAARNRAVVIFLDEVPAHDCLADIRGVNNEVLALGVREIYVHYGDGMRDSRLKIPAAKQGTARNLNTVAKLVEMSTTSDHG